MFRYTNPKKTIDEQSKFGPGSPAWRAATSGKPAASAAPSTPALPGGGTPALPSQGSSGAIVPTNSNPPATPPVIADRPGMGGVGASGFRSDMARLAASVEQQKKEAEEAAKAAAAKAEAEKTITVTDVDKSGVGRTIQVPAGTGVLSDPRRGTRLRSPDRETVVPFDAVLQGPVAQGRQITRTVAEPVQTQTQQPLATTEPTAVTTPNRPEETIRKITRTVAPVQQTQTVQEPVVRKPTQVVTPEPTQPRQPRERAESLPPMSMMGMRMGGGAGMRMQGTPGSQGVPPTRPTPPSVVVNPPAQPSSSSSGSTRNERIAAFLSQQPQNNRRQRINAFLSGETPSRPPVSPAPQQQDGSTEDQGPGPFAQALSQVSANISKVRSGQTLSSTDYENAFRKLGALKQPISDIASRIGSKIKSFFGGGSKVAPPGAVPPVYPKMAPPGAVPPVVRKPPIHTIPGDQSGASYMDPFGMGHGRPATKPVVKTTRNERIGSFLSGQTPSRIKTLEEDTREMLLKHNRDQGKA